MSSGGRSVIVVGFSDEEIGDCALDIVGWVFVVKSKWRGILGSTTCG